MKKIPYMIVFGEKEMNSNTINVRTIKGNTAENISRDLFIDKIKEEISSRSLNLSF